MSIEDELRPEDEAIIQTFESATDAALKGDFSELEAMLPEPEPNFFMPARYRRAAPLWLPAWGIYLIWGW